MVKISHNKKNKWRIYHYRKGKQNGEDIVEQTKQMVKISYNKKNKW